MIGTSFDPIAVDEAGPPPEVNSRRKADVIALYAWRLGVTFEQLGTLPYSDKHDRHRPSLRRFATAAFRAAGVDENVPHKRTSETWRYLREALNELADRERFGFGTAPARDLLEQRAQWLPTVVELPGAVGDREVAIAVAFRDVAEGRPVTPLAPEPHRVRRVRPSELAPYASDEAPALVTSGCPPALAGSTAGPPRGWLEFARLDPVPGRSCRWCGAPAVVGTLNGWRCAQHWPVPGDPRGDWGWQMNWSPKRDAAACLLSRCYCGRCPHYDVTGQPVRSLRGGA